MKKEKKNQKKMMIGFKTIKIIRLTSLIMNLLNRTSIKVNYEIIIKSKNNNLILK